MDGTTISKNVPVQVNNLCMVITEINEIAQEAIVVLYPNPVDNKIYIAGIKSTANLGVYSSTGLLMLKGTGTSIDVGNLSPGTYFIRISSGDKNQTYTFIKR